MVDENKIYNALKALLDDDSTLGTLLGTGKGGAKIVTGSEMPRYVPPMVQIIIPTNEIGIVMNESELTFRLNVYSREKIVGEIDLEEIEGILQRCHDLIHDQDLTVSDHRIFEMFAEGRDPPIRDRDNPKVSFGGLRCRMFAIKTA